VNMKRLIEMPDNARVWIYQASRFLTSSEIEIVESEVSAFLADWTSHGVAMDAAFEISLNRMLVIAADESMASGCGIDKSVKCIQALGSRLEIDFFQRTVVLYRMNDQLRESSLHEFWALRKALVVNDETQVVDTTVKSLGEYRSEFQKTFSRSWHAEMWGR
jgi:hypothetical protein